MKKLPKYKLKTTFLLFLLLVLFAYFLNKGFDYIDNFKTQKVVDTLINEVADENVEGVDYIPNEVIVKLKDPTNLEQILAEVEYDPDLNQNVLGSFDSNTPYLKESKDTTRLSKILLVDEGIIIGVSNVFPKNTPKLLNAASNRSFEVGSDLSSDIYSVFKIRVGESTDIFSIIKKLEQNPNVLYAEPNYIVEAASVVDPNDPLFSQQWALKNTGQDGGVVGEDINIINAWKISAPKNPIKYCIVDGGVYSSSSSDPLQNDMGKEWVNTLEIPNNGVDDDANGFIDDVNGWDFTNNRDSSYNFGSGHGQASAVVVSSKINNGVGLAGISDTSVFVDVVVLKDLSGSYLDVSKGVKYSVDVGCKIINLSLQSTKFSQVLYDSLLYAKQSGVLVVAAAGNGSKNNDNSPVYPASYDIDNIISTSATNNLGVLTEFSNYGPVSVDISAPGDNIIYYKTNDQVLRIKGTSLSVPHVTGVAALVWENFPNFDYQKVKRSVIEGARVNNKLEGKVFGNKSLDAYGALVRAGQIENNVFIPVGAIGGFNSSLNTVNGWSCDKDLGTTPTQVHIYYKRKGSSENFQFLTSGNANKDYGQAVANICGDRYHGFSVNLTDKIVPTVEYEIKVYAIDYGKDKNMSGVNPEIGYAVYKYLPILPPTPTPRVPTPTPRIPTPVPNQIPVINSINLSSNNNYVSPSNVTITVSASDPDGSVSSVEFFNGSTKLHTDTSAPFSYTWTNRLTGTSTIIVKAKDNNGAFSSLSSKSFTVKAAPTPTPRVPTPTPRIPTPTPRVPTPTPTPTPSIPTPNKPPVINSISFSSNNNYVDPSDVTVSVSASDPDGTVSSVEFYHYDSLLHTDNTPPFTYTWSGRVQGGHLIKVRAKDNNGTYSSYSTKGFTVNSTLTPTPNIISLDVNNDKKQDILDVITAIKVVFNNQPSSNSVDVNGDGKKDILDVIKIIQAVFSGSPS